ncbi:MAG TPA: bacterial transcriptional activator domain-containing protein [Pyrinomonadaceae bacterium]|nr:bacterial transcriptional activator domain-containing protein [Pyrinomonadaceae bacterium]
MATLNISLLGRFRAETDEREAKGLGACKVQELLCYLLTHRERAHSRESLAGLLWGEHVTEKSKKYLRQTLWHLQTALEPFVGPDSARVLTVEHDWVGLNLGGRISLDVVEFERAFALVRGVPSAEVDEEKARAMRAAVGLYKGDLLEGWYQDWCLFERERLENMYLSMLNKLLAYSTARREFEAGFFYGELILRRDRASERTHRQLMRLQHMAGDRTAALRQYERCVAALGEELSVEPDRRTVALYRQIRADQLGVEPETTTPPAPAASATTPAPDEATAVAPASLAGVLQRLRHLQAVLDEVQRAVRRELKAVEVGLKEFRQ